MDEASESLVRTRYFESERASLAAMDLAMGAQDYERMARIVSGYWVNFAKHGDPNGPGLPHWPRYERATDRLLDLGETITVRKPERGEQLRFLDGLYEAALGAR